jgi:hypothetical protein
VRFDFLYNFPVLKASNHEDVLGMTLAPRNFNVGCRWEVASFKFRPFYSGENFAKVSWLSKIKSLTLKISLPFYRPTPHYKLHVFLTGHTH